MAPPRGRTNTRPKINVPSCWTKVIIAPAIVETRDEIIKDVLIPNLSMNVPSQSD